MRTLPDSLALRLRNTEERLGHPLRVLHIGNIANNAYLNARILNEAGIANHVLCADYFHSMAWPEWEDLDFDGNVGDSFAPVFPSEESGGFRRPRWFAQGPRLLCLKWLEQLVEGRDSDFWWKVLSWSLGLPSLRSKYRVWRILEALSDTDFRRLLEMVRSRVPMMNARSHSRDRAFIDHMESKGIGREHALDLKSALDGLKPMLVHYDLVVGYATEGWYPMAASVPYLAYEHGTIRSLPFEDSEVGRLCAATYRHADGVLITNCDAIDAAQKLELEDFRFVPHPVNERVSKSLTNLRERYLEELGADFLVFHPARQHWEARRHPSWEKGNDIFIRGFAQFIAKSERRAGAIFVNWGQTAEDSRELARELGISDRIAWIEPQPHLRMAAYIEAVDVVADQFFLGAFGSITPKALCHGKPTLVFLDEDRHRWAFPELPPVCNASEPSQVADHLLRLSGDEEVLRAVGAASKSWYERWHSNRVVRDTLLSAFLDVLEPKQP